jgi:hypothetical protein
MDHGLPLHQSKDGVDTAQRVRNRPTHRTSGDHTGVQGMPTLDRNTTTSLPPLTRESGLKRFIRRFKGEGRHVPGWTSSVHALITSSSDAFSPVLAWGCAHVSSHLPIGRFFLLLL